jgi:hypothetical protein
MKHGYWSHRCLIRVQSVANFFVFGMMNGVNVIRVDPRLNASPFGVRSTTATVR